MELVDHPVPEVQQPVVSSAKGFEGGVGGRWHPVIDLSSLNRYVTLTKFKMELVSCVRIDKERGLHVPGHPQGLAQWCVKSPTFVINFSNQLTSAESWRHFRGTLMARNR